MKGIYESAKAAYSACTTRNFAKVVVGNVTGIIAATKYTPSASRAAGGIVGTGAAQVLPSPLKSAGKAVVATKATAKVGPFAFRKNYEAGYAVGGRAVDAICDGVNEAARVAVNKYNAIGYDKAVQNHEAVSESFTSLGDVNKNVQVQVDASILECKPFELLVNSKGGKLSGDGFVEEEAKPANPEHLVIGFSNNNANVNDIADIEPGMVDQATQYIKNTVQQTYDACTARNATKLVVGHAAGLATATVVTPTATGALAAGVTAGTTLVTAPLIGPAAPFAGAAAGAGVAAYGADAVYGECYDKGQRVGERAVDALCDGASGAARVAVNRFNAAGYQGAVDKHETVSESFTNLHTGGTSERVNVKVDASALQCDTFEILVNSVGGAFRDVVTEPAKPFAYEKPQVGEFKGFGKLTLIDSYYAGMAR